MKIHVLGICGTFMAGIAQLAKQCGHQVSGCDQNIYPPMSTLLDKLNIPVSLGYDPANISKNTDIVIVGNVIKRGNSAMEYLLNEEIPYISGPQWLYENVLKTKWVLAVAGTHGKTTTTSMLTWLLHAAGKNPSFLIGGVPENFGVSARLTDSSYFVIEADEYDCAFFDKRSKFLHYHPKTLILNNLEYDHADIFSDLFSIQQQFHYLIRTIPQNGLIIKNGSDENLKVTLQKGCWTPVTSFAGKDSQWQARKIKEDGSEFVVINNRKDIAEVKWSLLGDHNVQNALAALSAANHAGIDVQVAAQALTQFKNVKRRLEVKSQIKNITIYDDFAHHPTAIATTLAGLRSKIGDSRILAVLEFGSYTMRSGIHNERLKDALKDANLIFCKKPNEASWDLGKILKPFTQQNFIANTVDDLISTLKSQVKSGDHIVVMSNGGFDGIHQKLLNALT